MCRLLFIAGGRVDEGEGEAETTGVGEDCEEKRPQEVKGRALHLAS